MAVNDVKGFYVYDEKADESGVAKLHEDALVESLKTTINRSKPSYWAIQDDDGYVEAINDGGKTHDISASKLTGSALDFVSAIAKNATGKYGKYEEIAEIVRSGYASDVFDIGDQIVTTYTATDGKTYEMPWDIVAFEDATVESGLVIPGMVIQSHYATVEAIQFDAAEPTRPASQDYSGQIAQHGWNRYAYSAYRQWLNSDADVGGWWESQNDFDVAPSQLNSVHGFMAGLPSDFLAMLKPTKVETARNYRYPSGASGTYVYDTTYDMFFLPSREQEYISANEPNHREGKAWQYWVDRLTPEAIEKGEALPQATYSSAGVTHTLESHIRYALDNHASAQNCRLRSAIRDAAHTVWFVSSSGYVYGSALASYRCAPACVIC